MALEPIALSILIDECRGAEHNGGLLSLGYPDILAAPGQFDDIPERADADAVRKWHNWPHRIPDTDKAFESLGLKPLYVDIAAVRGPEIVLDLNDVHAREMRSNFRFVIDPGTSEHIFNIGNAFAFIARMCSVGGVVIHTNPCNMGNHGFWGINPTAYIDWYEANGFKVEYMREMNGPVSRRAGREAQTTVRFEALPNSTIICRARKISDVPVTWPIQTKYRQNPTLKGAA